MNNEYWMRIASMMAEKSDDPSTKVGAVIAKFNEDTQENEMVSWGYNDLCPGTPYSAWADRETKYRHVIHAEMMAIQRAGVRTKDATIYTTKHPCRHCALHIAAAGFNKVVCPAETCDRWINEALEAAAIFDRAGIELVYI